MADKKPPELAGEGRQVEEQTVGWALSGHTVHLNQALPELFADSKSPPEEGHGNEPIRVLERGSDGRASSPHHRPATCPPGARGAQMTKRLDLPQAVRAALLRQDWAA